MGRSDAAAGCTRGAASARESGAASAINPRRHFDSLAVTVALMASVAPSANTRAPAAVKAGTTSVCLEASTPAAARSRLADSQANVAPDARVASSSTSSSLRGSEGRWVLAQPLAPAQKRLQQGYECAAQVRRGLGTGRVDQAAHPLCSAPLNTNHPVPHIIFPVGCAVLPWATGSSGTTVVVAVSVRSPLLTVRAIR